MSRYLKKSVLCQIINSANIELVLDTFAEIKSLNSYDHTLHNKLLNLKPSLEKQAKKNYETFIKDSEDIIHQTYFRTQNLFEFILELGKSGDYDRFASFLELVEAFQHNELTIIEDVKEERLPQLQEPKGDV